MNKKALAKRQRKGHRPRRPREPAPQDMTSAANTKRGVLRTALFCIWLLATAAYTFIWCNSHMQFWRARDSVIAEHATVVREPYWADALTNTINPGVENAGWTIDVRVAGLPAVIPVALADFEATGKYLAADKPPAGGRYKAGDVFPIWFLSDARRFAPASIAAPRHLPVVLFDRLIWPRSTSFVEALHRAWGEPSLTLYDYVTQSERALGGVVSLLFLLGITAMPLRRDAKTVLHR